jgi:hypothetical protein
MHVRSPHDLSTLAEASMVPEVEATVRAYAALEEAVRLAPHGGTGLRQCLDALFKLANELPPALSPRVEALRRALLAFGRALGTVASARDLHSLGQDGIAPLERAVSQLARLVRGARRRLAETGDDEELASGAAIRLLDFGVERAMRGSRDGLEGGISTAAETLRLELPEVLSELAILAIDRLSRLPAEAPAESMPSFIPLLVRKIEPLPPWMPPGRIVGGFYVMRALGSGAGGSVFVARRTEEQDDDAERFALKVPDYDGSAARALTEEEFLQLFRGEAGALLALPPHANLARFVTFDAGARPKPILVMELVEGPSLERAIEVGDFTMSEALDVLEGVGRGLAAMHDVGVAHLDVKPSNVILRLRAENAQREPVLVDFGLAGRHLRPGCATAEYGAPEVWGNGRAVSSPLPADVYALGCVCYEVLAGRTLFQGPNEIALITAHLTHDGKPPGVRALLADPATLRLGELLVRMLRTDPLARASIEEVRYALGAVRADLEGRPWPLAPTAPGPQPHA